MRGAPVSFEKVEMNVGFRYHEKNNSIFKSKWNKFCCFSCPNTKLKSLRFLLSKLDGLNYNIRNQLPCYPEICKLGAKSFVF